VGKHFGFAFPHALRPIYGYGQGTVVGEALLEPIGRVVVENSVECHHQPLVDGRRRLFEFGNK
jgi:hypothetical protein